MHLVTSRDLPVWHVKGTFRNTSFPGSPNLLTAQASLPGIGLNKWGLGRTSTAFLGPNIYLA